MPQPSINDCKNLAYDLRKRGVLILTVSDGQIAGASYGMTRRECDAMKRLLDQIVTEIESGAFAIPEFSKGGA